MQDKFECISFFDILNLENDSQFFEMIFNFRFGYRIRISFFNFFKIVIIFVVTSFNLRFGFDQLDSKLNLITYGQLL